MDELNETTQKAGAEKSARSWTTPNLPPGATERATLSEGDVESQSMPDTSPDPRDFTDPDEHAPRVAHGITFAGTTPVTHVPKPHDPLPRLVS